MSSEATLLASSRERDFLEKVNAEVRAVRENHPHWYADYEDIDPYTADRPYVEHLLQTAPTEFMRGLVTGILLMRQQVATMTGREF